MANTLTICLSSYYSMQLNEYRNNEGGNKELLISTLGKSALIISSVAEAAIFGGFAIGSTIYYPISDVPFTYFSSKLSSAHFTIYRNIADLLLTFSNGHFPVTELDARREFDESTFCTLVKVVIAATNSYLLVNAVPLILAASTAATILKITLSVGYFSYMIAHRFGPENPQEREDNDPLDMNIHEFNSHVDETLNNLGRHEPRQANRHGWLNEYLEGVELTTPELQNDLYRNITPSNPLHEVHGLREPRLRREESQWETPPAEALDPQAGPTVQRLTDAQRAEGTQFLRNEIFGKIDVASATAMFGEWDSETFNYVLALTSYVYVFGSKENDPLPAFLKPESRNGITALRYVFGNNSNSEVPASLPEQTRQKIETLRDLGHTDHTITRLQLFMIQNPLAEQNAQRFLSLELFKKDRAADGDSDLIRAFFANEGATRLLNELKIATIRDIADSDFVTVCYQNAMPEDED